MRGKKTVKRLVMIEIVGDPDWVDDTLERSLQDGEHKMGFQPGKVQTRKIRVTTAAGPEGGRKDWDDRGREQHDQALDNHLPLGTRVEMGLIDSTVPRSVLGFQGTIIGFSDRKGHPGIMGYQVKLDGSEAIWTDESEFTVIEDGE